MDFTQLTTVSCITVISYGIGFICRDTPKIDNKYIPKICIAVGAIFGAISFFVIPDFPANNIIDAIAVGIASGGLSTGINQAVVVQPSKEEK